MQEKATSAEQAMKRLDWKCKDIERDRDAKGTSLSETQVICENLMLWWVRNLVCVLAAVHFIVERSEEIEKWAGKWE